MRTDKEDLDRYLRDGAMTLNELIEKLEEIRSGDKDGRGELPVVFQYDYGDHWHTPVAEKISSVEDGEVKWSSYHKQPSVSDSEIEDEVEEKTSKTRQVVLIS